MGRGEVERCRAAVDRAAETCRQRRRLLGTSLAAPLYVSAGTAADFTFDFACTTGSCAIEEFDVDPPRRATTVTFTYGGTDCGNLGAKEVRIYGSPVA